MRYFVHAVFFLTLATPALARENSTLMFGGRAYAVSTVSREFYADAIARLNPLMAPLEVQSCTEIIEVPGGFAHDITNYGALCKIAYKGQVKTKLFCVNSSSGHIAARDAGEDVGVYDMARYVIDQCVGDK